jgi:hypothetical protein
MRKLDIGSLPDRVSVSAIGGRLRIMFRAATGEEIAADLSAAQVAVVRDGIDAILQKGRAPEGMRAGRSYLTR